ncbi:hypothetical protein BLOT_000335 [Blomia tropicalis]|nr:hypothetical protein BLOT_000335 [Blomia tropicalis]
MNDNYNLFQSDTLYQTLNRASVAILNGTILDVDDTSSRTDVLHNRCKIETQAEPNNVEID